MTPTHIEEIANPRWFCDYNGYEVGYTCKTVGFFACKARGIEFFIDNDTDKILEIWKEDE